MNELDKRIIKGINHFRGRLQEQLSGKDKVHLNVLFNLIESRLNGEVVYVNELTNEPRFEKTEKEKIEEVFPKSEGYEHINAAGLTNALSESPDETVSQRTEDFSLNN